LNEIKELDGHPIIAAGKGEPSRQQM
jgi:hypothetical protein